MGVGEEEERERMGARKESLKRPITRTSRVYHSAGLPGR